MSLRSLLEKRPIVLALAGPNGAGKSTFFDGTLADTGLYFVNADVLALRMGMGAYAAAELADKLRRQLVERRESFIFETVFSDPVGDKIEFLKQAEKAGYTVFLIFIGIGSPAISNERVAMRASAGGHDIPDQKLIERFPRTLKNLQIALVKLPNVWVFDHSDLDAGYRLVATKEDGGTVNLHRPTPNWLLPLLPRK